MMLSFQLLQVLCTLFASATAFQGSALNHGGRLNSAAPAFFRTSRTTTTAVGVGWTMEPTNDDIQLAFTRAKDFTSSCEEGGECSLEEASNLLQDLTLLLSKCGGASSTSTGTTLEASENAVCENQDVAAEVVAKLRMFSSSSTAAAISEEGEHQSFWRTIEIPLAILYYFACIFAMIHYGELGVNSVDFHDTSARAFNEYSMSSATGNGLVPPAFINPDHPMFF